MSCIKPYYHTQHFPNFLWPSIFVTYQCKQNNLSAVFHLVTRVNWLTWKKRRKQPRRENGRKMQARYKYISWFICAALWATFNHNISLFVQHVRDIHWSIENPKHFVDANSGKEFDGKFFTLKLMACCITICQMQWAFSLREKTTNTYIEWLQNWPKE